MEDPVRADLAQAALLESRAENRWAAGTACLAAASQQMAGSLTEDLEKAGLVPVESHLVVESPAAYLAAAGGSSLVGRVACLEDR